LRECGPADGADFLAGGTQALAGFHARLTRAQISRIGGTGVLHSLPAALDILGVGGASTGKGGDKD
jgi:hypothetical protein